MVRGILTWVDKKMDEAYREEKVSKKFAKAASAGAVEGAIDGATIVGLTLAAIGVVATVIEKTKR